MQRNAKNGSVPVMTEHSSITQYIRRERGGEREGERQREGERETQRDRERESRRRGRA